MFVGAVASTAMNLESSRSHAIFSITVETSVTREDKQQHVKMGRLHLVDLAVSSLKNMCQECNKLAMQHIFDSLNFRFQSFGSHK